MANPIGLMVAAIGWVWDGIKSMISMLPDALIPDGWKASVEDAGKRWISSAPN
ncbi:hypothetical protein PVK64_11815 [Aliivibrio sp. S4TY2]|nr:MULTISPECIES: hypothetical protein [unclassified Aliivibrio]MDD9156861.1 hypothetical protein [Aliivibrio sp. S4TY2]MDD9160925.1 hypothetical protein [Aliivibrio sp. S4TY1]MDD9168770.1 hypothetical protein [Aliivibrio sp. S4MY4]MDD9185299.1 hypothetical protein [Aliivibrio sp. S4MY3]MDD9203261.1 hypothetical protein [Aliivibrio sp. S4MY1]